MNDIKYVYPLLQRQGIGNLLFPWARAVVYSRQEGVPIIAPSWARVTRIGPWLRGERYKRFYGGDFSNSGYIKGLRKWWLLHFKRKQIYFEQGMKDHFLPFIGHQFEIKKELFSIVNPEIIKRYEEIKCLDGGNYVAVHVRRGDFKQAGRTTEDEWFVRGLSAALELNEANTHTAIRVFSDGYPEELAFLLKKFSSENIIVMPKAPAIQDILVMSHAKVLVCSPRSTFSMWGVFLGQMPSIWKDGSGLIPPELYMGHPQTILVK